jgi:hypothetical protein
MFKGNAVGFTVSWEWNCSFLFIVGQKQRQHLIWLSREKEKKEMKE